MQIRGTQGTAMFTFDILVEIEQQAVNVKVHCECEEDGGSER